MEIKELIDRIKSYNPQADVDTVNRAYTFAKSKHEGQLRRSGEPYILHPLSVSGILAELHMDTSSIVTGLLHDTVEDTTTTLQEVLENFGPEVRDLVDGVTKISRISFRTSEEKLAENFRKMLVAMAKDIRVVLVKLADRLHNMRTLNHLPPPKQVEISQETLDIYCPMANRLGMSWVKTELEDLCLRYLKPEVYFKLAKKVAKKKQERQKYVEDVRHLLETKLSESGIHHAQVRGRSKHFYSIYKKMEKSNLSFEQIYDLLAFRIIVKTIPQCYETLGLVHSLWKPVPGRFKDYIAMPKPNLYQSLHSTVIGPLGERMEIQIRTEEMNEIADFGVAAHWKYKEGHPSKKTSHEFEWLRRLVQWQDEKDPMTFMEGVKLDLFQGDVFVFSPRGDVYEFPSGSTPLDFAYAIHTDLGHQCMGAKVNGRIVPLKYTLKSGDTIEIVRSPTQKPSKDWLKLVKTSRAKSKIRNYIQQQERKEAQLIGQDLLDKELKKYGKSLNAVRKTGQLEAVVSSLSVPGIEDFFVRLGFGKIEVEKIVEQFVPTEERHQKEPEQEPSFLKKIFKSAANRSKSKSGITVHGVDDVLIRLAKCCHPLPGDSIVGYITRGRGVSVHSTDCPVILDADETRRVDVKWDHDVETERVVRIKIVCMDEPGALMSMTKSIASKEVNIHHAQCSVTRDRKAINVFDISVRDTAHLREVIQELEKLHGVISVERVRSA